MSCLTGLGLKLERDQDITPTSCSRSTPTQAEPRGARRSGRRPGGHGVLPGDARLEALPRPPGRPVSATASGSSRRANRNLSEAFQRSFRRYRVANVAAIIGLSGRFPGEPTIENLWHSLGDEAAANTSGAAEPWISRTRLFADGGKAALDNAAYTSRLDAGRTGFFAGGAEGDTLAADVAGELGLEGPAVTVQPPCHVAGLRVDRARLPEPELRRVRPGAGGREGGPGRGHGSRRAQAAARRPGGRRPHPGRGPRRGGADPPAGPPRGAPGRDNVPDTGRAQAGARAAGARQCVRGAANRLEAAIAGLWQEELGIDRVGVDDNFFELGGTSIAGVQIIALLKDWLHQDIPTVSLYEGPTVSARCPRSCCTAARPRATTPCASAASGGGASFSVWLARDSTE